MLRLLIFLWVACKREDDEPVTPEPPPPIVPGPPEVGAAEGELKLPVGSPLSGYTARCSCMSGQSRVDKRDSAYNYSFVESAGIHTTPTIKAIWIENGDDHLVLTKTDQIYSYEGIVIALTEALEASTGENLQGKVVHATNHSHNSYGSFSKHKTFYLGSDLYNEEQFQNEVAQIASVALEAYQNRQPAKIGIGWSNDWDPNDDVYHDRRSSNNDLAVWPDAPPGMGKDPHVALMRFDTLDDQPIAIGITFGMHGILGSETNPLVSADASLSVEQVLREQFDDQVVVMFTQGGGGDASPSGSDEEFAREESIGLHAVDALYSLWESTPTSSDDVTLHTTSRHIPQLPEDIHVTRNGTVDMFYTPYDEDRHPDNVVYNDDGSLVGEIDEFNTLYGAAFCGQGEFDFPVGGIDVEVWPYSQCMQVEFLSRLILAFFDLSEDQIELPFPELTKAHVSATLLGPLPTLLPDGSTTTQDLLVGYFPGEATAMYTEQWRRRVENELGYHQPLMISYAQDHEGYLLIPEDWLTGGYEPDITMWGPLAAEHYMEQAIVMVDEVLGTGLHTDPDPDGTYSPPVYDDFALPTVQPDTTPDAGTRLFEHPTLEVGEEHREALFLPMEMTLDLDTPDEVPRIQGQVQLLWKGGDPGVDFPNVVLEREENGAFVPVTTRSGRPITEALPDILVSYTPDPLFPVDAEQDHYWFATWQAVGHLQDRVGLPEGTYRLRVSGKRYAGGSDHWPWATEDYEVVGDEFALVPGAITIEREDAGLVLSYEAGPNAYRLITLNGRYDGHSPLEGTVTVTVNTDGADSTDVDTATGTVVDGRTHLPWTDFGQSVTVTDAYGNTGTLVTD